MEVKDCTHNKRVALISREQPCNKGTIKGEAEAHPSYGHAVIVEWDGGQLQKVSLRSLITEEEGKAQDARIKAEQEKLENEWAETEAKVKSKIKEATAAISQAIDLAHKAGHDLYDLRDAVYPLTNVLERVGWVASSC